MQFETDMQVEITRRHTLTWEDDGPRFVLQQYDPDEYKGALKASLTITAVALVKLELVYDYNPRTEKWDWKPHSTSILAREILPNGELGEHRALERHAAVADEYIIQKAAYHKPRLQVTIAEAEKVS